MGHGSRGSWVIKCDLLSVPNPTIIVSGLGFPRLGLLISGEPPKGTPSEHTLFIGSIGLQLIFP